MNSCIRFRSVASCVAVLTVFSFTSLYAGPPLICHPYEIGGAVSLPGGKSGLGTSDIYDRSKLVADTLALLTADMPVIVRMETLRRAAIYATDGLRGRDRNRGYTAAEIEAAQTLLARLYGRVGDTAGNARALAMFDAGFFAETLRQAGMALELDGYELLLQAAALRPDDAEMKFALALAGLDQRRPDQVRFLADARRAAPEGSLLAANLASHFGGR